MPNGSSSGGPCGAKFSDPQRCADGQARASVALTALKTLWVNTGTLCNLSCEGCYIESSPHNDRLAWFRPSDLRQYLAEIHHLALPVAEIGFTGGEPFMNPQIIDLLEMALSTGARVLVLSNGLTPLRHHRSALTALVARFPQRLSLRLSLDHWQLAQHEQIRGPRTFAPVLAAAQWLAPLPVSLTLAGRTCWGEDEATARAGYDALCRTHALPIACTDPAQLVLFPEMQDPAAEAASMPEITTACWDILGQSPAALMCASARMVVRRAGAEQPRVLACTLIAYDPRFDLGQTLAESVRPVPLMHPHCATFCVLGGAKCSG
jgi:organic radical activating enzyme